jgi:hypothetical protein
MIIKSKKTVEVEVEVEVNFPIFGKNNYHTYAVYSESHMVAIFTLGKYSSISKDYNNVVQVIEKCLEKITNDFRFNEHINYFNNHKKKDDLSDSFLQGLWFIKNKI